MKNFSCLLILIFILSGCATKMAYLNTARTSEEIRKDKEACAAKVNASDLKDPALKQKKINDCMRGKGYKVVSEAEAEKIQGFHELWVKPESDLKAYEVILIDPVDVSKIKVGDTLVPGTKITDKDINNLAEKMAQSFSKSLGAVMPVTTDKEKTAGKKALLVNLRLNNISPNDIGLNAALEVAGKFAPVPLPGAPEGAFAFEGEISDLSSNEKLVVFLDTCTEDKNGSLLGLEKFEKWKHAYNIIDYWADHLAGLIARERGQEYKSQLGWKLVDF